MSSPSRPHRQFSVVFKGNVLVCHHCSQMDIVVLCACILSFLLECNCFLMLVSAVQHWDSALGMHLSPPPWGSAPLPRRSSPSGRLGSLCCTAAPLAGCCHTWLCAHVGAAVSTRTALLPPLCPQVPSLHLRLYTCPTSGLISTICLDSIYMH